MADPVYVVCRREGLKVELLGFYRNESYAQAEVELRNKGNWYSHYYVSEVNDLG